MDLKRVRKLVKERFGTDGNDRVNAFLDICAGRRPAQSLHPDQEATRLFFPDLEASAWHDAARFGWKDEVEAAWRDIRDEYVALRTSDVSFHPYEDPHTGDLGWKGWETWRLYEGQHVNAEAADRCPMTMAALQASGHGIREGMFSVLTPGTHLEPHTGGVNLMLTVHLPLRVPEGDLALRASDETRVWKEGELVVFDDSFIHEAWNRTEEDRIVLLWDIWHPDLTAHEVSVLEFLVKECGLLSEVV